MSQTHLSGRQVQESTIENVEIDPNAAIDRTKLKTIPVLTSISIPGDADMIEISDITNSNISKSLSWSNIKSTLKSYFDTVYNGIISKATYSDVFAGTDNSKYITPFSLKESGVLSSSPIASNVGFIPPTGMSSLNVQDAVTEVYNDLPTGNIPNLTLGIENIPGSSNNFIREDDTILVFDTTIPSTFTLGNTATTGSSSTAARRDHTHNVPPPVNITGNAGTVTNATFTKPLTVDTGPVTLHGAITSSSISFGNSAYLSGTNTGDQTGGTPSLTLGTSNIPGSSTNFLRTDDSILVFDSIPSSTLNFGDSSSIGTAPTAARRDHRHAMPPTPVNVTGNAGTVTNATFNTSLTVSNGNISLYGDTSNNSALIIGNGTYTLNQNVSNGGSPTFGGLKLTAGTIAAGNIPISDAYGNLTLQQLATEDSGVALTALATGFSASGGTSPKTLNVFEDTTLNGVATDADLVALIDNTKIVTPASLAYLNLGSYTNITLNTSLIVNTGYVTLDGNSNNTSVLTIGSGSNFISGTNTGDQTGGTPNLTLGTSNIPGSSSNFLRRDDTILVFDTTIPITQNFGDSASVGVATVAARRDHSHGMPSMPTPSMIGSVATTFNLNGNQLSGTSLTLTPSMIGSPSGSGTSTGTNTGDQTNISGNAGTVTNATFTTPLTVSNGSVTLQGSVSGSVVILGQNVNVSGTNTGDQTGGTPNLTLGTSNIPGSSSNFLRRDDTILVFDTTAPITQNFGDSASVGVATVAARRDHSHGMPSMPTPSQIGSVATTFTINGNTLSGTSLTLTPTMVGSPSGSGTSTGTNTGDQTGGTPNLTLGTSNIPGSSSNFLRRDDTILVFDTTAPITQNFGDSASVGVATVAARRDHSHGMPSMPTPSQIGSVATTFTINGNQLSGTSLTLNASSVGAVASSITINGQSLTSNITLTPSNIGAISTNLTINGTQIGNSTNITLNVSSIGGVATTFQINGNQLSGTSLTLTPTMVGSPSGSGTSTGTNTGDQTGGTPNLTLGTSNIPGSSSNFLRRDDTILVFDATVPSTLAFGSSASIGSASVAARRDHSHGMPSMPTPSQIGSVATTFTINGNQLSGTSLTLNASSVGAVASSITINGQSLTSNITLTPAMIGSPSTSLTINGHNIGSSIIISSSDVGAVATTFQINGNQLSGTGLTLNASNIGAVATTFTINGTALGSATGITVASTPIIATYTDILQGTDNTLMVTPLALANADMGGVQSIVNLIANVDADEFMFFAF